MQRRKVRAVARRISREKDQARHRRPDLVSRVEVGAKVLRTPSKRGPQVPYDG